MIKNGFTFRTFLGLIIIFTLSLLTLQCKGPDSDKKQKQDQAAENQPVKSTNTKEPAKLVHDEKGNIIERHNKSYRKADGSLRSIDDYYYKYDDRGNVIEEIKESHDAD
ncbi:MAG: hypothetical protein R2764_07325 [Bacteroidales bacterium]